VVAADRADPRAVAVDRVVVFGGSGRIGRFVVRELRQYYDVVNADLVPGDADVEFFELDVLDLASVRAVTRGASAVCHLAGLDLDTGATAEDYVRVNALGSWNVLQAAAEVGVSKVVLMSSVAACGLSEMRPEWTAQSLPVDEEHESRPVHAYSVSKRLVEEMSLAFARGTSMQVSCFRAVEVVSPESLSAYRAQVEAPGRRWLFYYVTADDVARAFALALEATLPSFGVYFLSAADTSRPEPTLDWYPQRVGALPDALDRAVYEANPRAALFSSRKAREAFGWEPTTDYLELSAEVRNV